METKIIQVTVYTDRARVTRQGQINLEPGKHKLEVANLPAQMDPDSARLSVRGSAPARLLGMQVQRVHHRETPAEQARDLEAQIESLGDEIVALEARAELIRGERARLDALAGHTKVYAKALVKGQMTTESQLAFFDDLRARAGELDAELGKIQVNKRELERRLEQLKKQLEERRGARPLLRYTAWLEVEVLEPGDFIIELTYVVGRASWKPLYDLRLLEMEEETGLEVGYLAQVSQNTAEDWEVVSLSLSTARPTLAAVLPELDPWYVEPRQPPVPMPRRAPAPMQAKVAARSAMELTSPAAQAAPEVEAEEVQARVESSAAAVTYQVPGGTDVPADGAPHKVTVARFPLPPELDYVTAPRLVEAAYRRAKVVNDSPYTLLPGDANLFAGDEFIGATSLELTAPGGEIELYLGVDDRVKVERELKRRQVDKRLIGGKRRVLYAYEIHLENLLPSEAKVMVHDQIPVSRHEEIKVRLEAAEPRPSEHSQLNLLDWLMTLASGEKRTIRFDFSVEYPPEIEVAGLP